MFSKMTDCISSRKWNPSSSEIPNDAHTRMQIYSCNKPANKTAAQQAEILCKKFAN